MPMSPKWFPIQVFQIRFYAIITLMHACTYNTYIILFDLIIKY
jgi:hypothetical protein